MNSVTDKFEGLKAYLTGMGRTSPASLAFVAGYDRWPALALQEIERRATALLTQLPNDELVAIGMREVDLCKLAQQVQSEIGKEH